MGSATGCSNPPVAVLDEWYDCSESFSGEAAFLDVRDTAEGQSGRDQHQHAGQDALPLSSNNAATDARHEATLCPSVSWDVTTSKGPSSLQPPDSSLQFTPTLANPGVWSSHSLLAGTAPATDHDYALLPPAPLPPVRISRDRSREVAPESPDSQLAAGYDTPSSKGEDSVDPVTPESSPPEFSRLQLDDLSPLDEAVSTSGRDADTSAYPVHRAAFDGDVSTVLRLLALQPDIKLLDAQGNTVLHVAVLRRQYELVDTLLANGFPVKTPNARGWLALDEAVALKDSRLVKALHVQEVADLKAHIKAKKADLLATMRSMPDYGFKLTWELGSPIFGLVLRKYAPHDTYQVWKKGTCIRVDGSLMGMDDKASSIIPKWKRGHFSLLFDGGPTPAELYLVDRKKETYVDLTAERRQHKPDVDAEVRMLMGEGAGKSKLKPVEFRFKPVKTWLGNDATERIEGWKTRVFEATGKMVAITTTMAPLAVPKGATFDEYLRLEPKKDSTSEMAVDPLSMHGPTASSAGSAKAEDGEAELDEVAAAEMAKLKAKQGRKLSGKCWMAEDFPMSLAQLMPVLDVIGNANKHLARVGKFLQKYSDLSLFPVKLQVPLLMTVYLLVSFRKFHSLQATDPAHEGSFYRIPAGFKQKALKHKRGRSWSPDYDDLEGEDALI